MGVQAIGRKCIKEGEKFEQLVYDYVHAVVEVIKPPVLFHQNFFTFCCLAFSLTSVSGALPNFFLSLFFILPPAPDLSCTTGTAVASGSLPSDNPSECHQSTPAPGTISSRTPVPLHRSCFRGHSRRPSFGAKIILQYVSHKQIITWKKKNEEEEEEGQQE